MRNLICKLREEVTNAECKRCFKECNDIHATRAQCVKNNAIYITEPYVKMDDDYISSPIEEFIDAMIEEGDKDACFELNNIIWVGLIGMKKYVHGIKGFERQLIKEKFKIVCENEVKNNKLKGFWYKRIRRM